MFKDENQFWLGLWTVAAITIGTIIVSLLNYNIEQDQIIAQMILDGAHPIAANCALHDSMGNNPSCIVFLTNQ